MANSNTSELQVTQLKAPTLALRDLMLVQNGMPTDAERRLYAYKKK